LAVRRESRSRERSPATAEYFYGLFSIDLKTDKTETTDF
jgi:hypothetical protein